MSEAFRQINLEILIAQRELMSCHDNEWIILAKDAERERERERERDRDLAGSEKEYQDTLLKSAVKCILRLKLN